MSDEQSERRRRVVAYVFAALIVVIILLLLFRGCQPDSYEQRETAATPHGDAVLQLGDAVVTGFSGARRVGGKIGSGKTELDYTFIDMAGPSARIFDPRKPGHVWNGRYWAMPRVRDIPASAIGQVFGVAIDDRKYPNVYFSATSLYGLNLVLPDRDRDRIPERSRKGDPKAAWMRGQFGKGGGPGSIWKLDGRSGKVALFANVMFGKHTTGPASLGNIAYDAQHRELFVSDLSTGMIHRFSLKGRDLGSFDHGLTARTAAHLGTVPYDPNARVSIASAAFNTEVPSTWGFTAPARRVFGLATHLDRLYYAVADGTIWSVSLTRTGGFGNDPRLDITLPAGEAPVSDIAFTRDGAMIVAERASTGSGYDYRGIPAAKLAKVLRFWPEKPDDPDTPSLWYQQPEEYAVGFGRSNRSSDGGVALGYGYRSDGTLGADDCDDAIFLTGDVLRDFRQTKTGLEPGGPLLVSGLQIGPSGPVRGFNVPPSISYFANYADTATSDQTWGRIGSVRIYRRPCTGPLCVQPMTPAHSKAAALPPPAIVGSAAGGGGGGNTPDPHESGCTGANCTDCEGANCGGCTGTGCGPCPGINCGVCVGPDCCIGADCNPSPKMCMNLQVKPVCDTATGTWTYEVSQSGTSLIPFDTVTVDSESAGISVIGGPDFSIQPPPVNMSLSGGTAGSTVTLDVCGFNQADRDTGKPYDCCHEKVTFRIPRKICKKSDTGGQHP